MSGAGGGIGGSTDGLFFGTTPGWVDERKAPGYSSQMPPPWSSWLRGVLQLKHIVFSPNLIWLAITLVVYVLFPYDLEGARRDGFVPLWSYADSGSGGGGSGSGSIWGLHWSWWSSRVVINMGVMLLYYGGWEVAALRGRRKFNWKSWVSTQRISHNMYVSALWSMSGVPR